MSNWRYTTNIEQENLIAPPCSPAGLSRTSIGPANSVRFHLAPVAAAGFASSGDWCGWSAS